MIRITGACSRDSFSVDLCRAATSLSRARKVHATPPHLVRLSHSMLEPYALTPGRVSGCAWKLTLKQQG